jgi:hypothetical protein
MGFHSVLLRLLGVEVSFEADATEQGFREIFPAAGGVSTPLIQRLYALPTAQAGVTGCAVLDLPPKYRHALPEGTIQTTT